MTAAQQQQQQQHQHPFYCVRLGAGGLPELVPVRAE
jgi:hypothetical protein